MALDDFFESQVAVAVAATAVVLAPSGRRVLRRGAAYGLAGALIVGDAIASFGRGAARGIREAAGTAADGNDSEAQAAELQRASGGG